MQIMAMAIQQPLMTADDFFEWVNLPENDNRRFELDDGMMIEMPPSSPLNTVVAQRISYFLSNHVLPRDLGYITGPDVGFQLGAGHVRQPDVAFIAKSRLPELPSRFEIAPDLAVEVVSPNEDVLKKTREYLSAGTTLVWAVYPHEQIVEVFRAESPRWQTLTGDDTLDGGDILPDFSVPVRELFP